MVPFWAGDWDQPELHGAPCERAEEASGQSGRQQHERRLPKLPWWEGASRSRLITCAARLPLWGIIQRVIFPHRLDLKASTSPRRSRTFKFLSCTAVRSISLGTARWSSLPSSAAPTTVTRQPCWLQVLATHPTTPHPTSRVCVPFPSFVVLYPRCDWQVCWRRRPWRRGLLLDLTFRPAWLLA